MSLRTATLPALAILTLVSCQKDSALTAYIAPPTQPEIFRAGDPGAPPNAREGSCWGRDVSPAVVETVTEQIIVQPAEVLDDGTVLAPAIYRTETQQRIVKERRETWFETPCAEVWTEEFTASVQRALQARGLFRGQITSAVDNRTLTAIRKYQKAGGLDSAILSLESARRLGLVAVARDTQ